MAKISKCIDNHLAEFLKVGCYYINGKVFSQHYWYIDSDGIFYTTYFNRFE